MEDSQRQGSKGPAGAGDSRMKTSVSTVIKKNREYLPLKVYNFNSQGLTTKFHHLAKFVADKDPDVICITETFLTKDIPHTEFCPEGLCFRKDRELSDYPAGTYTNPARGGVAIIVKGSLNPRRYEEGDVDAEIVWVKIHPLENVQWLVGCCYL